MKQNMSGADKALRILVAVAIAVLYFTGAISGTAAIVAGIIAVIFVLTSFVGFCPLYTIFGISTLKKKQ